MGEAKRKREEAARRKAERQAAWLKYRTLLGGALLLIGMFISPILAWWAIIEKGEVDISSSPTTSPEELRPQQDKSSPKQVPRQTVIDSPEGFAQLARKYERSSLPLDWQQAVTYWQAVCRMQPDNRDAWRGFARNKVRVLLLSHNQQPSKSFSAKDLADVSFACSEFLRLAREEPLAHELAAYSAAFHGHQEAAMMHASNSMMMAARQATPTSPSKDVMTDVILIASQRRNRFGSHGAHTIPGGPIDPGVPRPRFPR